MQDFDQLKIYPPEPDRNLEMEGGNRQSPSNERVNRLCIYPDGRLGLRTDNQNSELPITIDRRTAAKKEPTIPAFGEANFPTHIGSSNTRAHFAPSDARIKSIEGHSDGKCDLDILRRIQVVDYHYKDSASFGHGRHKKVLAQQVAGVFPQAVCTAATKIIPDILQRATASEGWIELEGHPLQAGDTVRLILEDGPKDFKVTAVAGNRFQIGEALSEEVMVYGREVSDFHSVDYDAIAMLNVSATQELANRQDQLEKDLMARFEQLEAQVDKLMAWQLLT